LLGVVMNITPCRFVFVLASKCVSTSTWTMMAASDAMVQ
jgi:hypothetical protein